MSAIRKIMLLGLGLISLTKEKAEEIVDELIKRGEIVKEERLKAIDKILEEAERQEKIISEKIGEIFRKIISEAGLPTKKDLAEVLRKLEEIEKKIKKD